MVTQAEILHPKDRTEWLQLRSANINSSEVAALFGLSPYMTPFELFHRKRDAVVINDGDDTPEHIRWGNRLESAIAHGLAEDNGWKIRPMKEYYRLRDERAGSSFDFEILDDDGLIECKNVIFSKFRDEWAKNEDGTHEAPPHIELQAMHQLWVSGKKFVVITPLVGGNQILPIRRERDEEVISAIQKAVRDFWKKVDRNEPPPPNFTIDTAFIAHLYRQATKGKTFDARGNAELAKLAEDYKDAQELEKRAKECKDAAKAGILMAVGDSEKVLGDDWSISAGTVAGCHVAYDRAAYRNFRLTWRKS